MNNITTQEIKDKLDAQIDYKELARILEADLNLIAEQVFQEEEYVSIKFKVFFDFGDFNTHVNSQAPGEGQHHRETPVVISLISGNYSQAKGPEIYSSTFRIEAFGFKSDKENLRKIFEAFSAMNQGANVSGLFNSSMATSLTDFPIMTTPEPYKGEDRMSVFMTWSINFIYTGQLSNNVGFKLDGESVYVTNFNIHRNREFKAVQKNDSDEMKASPENQSINITGTVVYDGTESTAKLMRTIKNLGTSMSDVFVFEVTWPALLDENEEPEVDVYEVHIIEGDVSVTEGSYVDLIFSAMLAL